MRTQRLLGIALSSLAMGAALSGWSQEKTTNSPPDVGLSQLTDARGLTDPFYRWNAKIVWPANPPAESDFTVATLKAWEFDKGDTEGITRFSGIESNRVADGKLEFTTRERPFFYWGDHFDDDGVAGLELDFQPPDFMFRPSVNQWYATIRLRQSLPESAWTISTRRAGMPAELLKREIVVKGTEWQEIRVPFSMQLGFGSAAPRFHSLCIEPGSAGNRVAIDWVRLSSRKLAYHVRKTIVLAKDVADAQVCLLPLMDYALYVNGQKAGSGTGVGARRNYTVVEIGKYLRRGQNVMAFEDTCDPNIKKLDALNGAAWEGVVHFTDGTFQRLFTDGREKAVFPPVAGWTETAFDDSAWPNVVIGPALAESCLPAKLKDGYGHFIDPPYLGPIDVVYPGAPVPEDTPRIFRQREGLNLTVKLPGKPGAHYELNYALQDAFTCQTVGEGVLKEAAAAEYPFTAKPESAGVYNLVLRARENGTLLDTRFVELALVGRVPQREVAWDRVEAETKQRLIAEIDCGNPADPHPFIEHPYYVGNGPPPAKPEKPLTQIVDALGKPCRETSERYGNWFGYRVAVQHPEKPHFVVVEYPDDRPQGFVVRAYYKARAYYTMVGDIGFSSPTVWALGGDPLHPPTHKMQKAQFLFYPRQKDIAVEVTNLQSGKRSVISRLWVYEVEDLPAPAIPQAQTERLFGSQTERANLRDRSFYAEPDYDVFACGYGSNGHPHFGWLKKWYLTIANQIRYMRYSGENMFFCGFYQYGAQVYFPIQSVHDRGPATPNYDSFTLMYALFAENDLALIPCVEFCFSYATIMQNRYTDKEVRQGAPNITIVSKDGRQVSVSGEKWNINPFHKDVRRAVTGVVADIAGRYGAYASFKGVGLIGGGLFWPGLYVDPRAPDWNSVLDYGWEDDTVRLFEERTGIAVPVDAKDPERFAKRFRWVTENRRNEWIDFRCREVLAAHLGIRDTIRQANSNAVYYAFLANNAPGSMAEYVVLKEKPIYEALRLMGVDPELYKQQAGLELGWFYYAEAFNNVNHSSLPGTFQTFNRNEALNELFDAGTNTASFLNVVWQEPDIFNTLYTNWVWQGSSQQNPNPWFGHQYYREPFVDRLLKQTPSTLGFIFTDGHLYTAESNLRRPFAVAFRSLPPGDYRTREGAGLDRNLTIREQVKNGQRCFYVVNPAWWDLKVNLRLSPGAEVLDRVNNATLKTRQGALALDLGGYDLRVFEVPEAVALSAAEAEISKAGLDWVKSRAELLAYLSAIGARETIRRFAFQERPEVTLQRLTAIQGDCASGYYTRALEALQHPLVSEVLKYLEARKIMEQSGKKTEVQNTYRIVVGRERPYTDSQGQVWSADQFYNYGLAAYGYVGKGGTVVLRGEVPIENTKDPEIYRAERFNVQGYCFRVPNGAYTLRLHFAEGWQYGLGRVVDLTVEDRTVLKDFDFNKEAGAFRTAYVKEIRDIAVTDGELAFSAAPTLNFKLNGIEVLPQ